MTAPLSEHPVSNPAGLRARKTRSPPPTRHRAGSGLPLPTERSTKSITPPSIAPRPATWNCSSPTKKPSVHEEKRDFEYDFHYIDENALAVRVVANDLGGRYTVTKEFITDPHHPVVLMNVSDRRRRRHPLPSQVLRPARPASRWRRRRQLCPFARYRRPPLHPRLEEQRLARLRRGLRFYALLLRVTSATRTAFRTSRSTCA